MKNRTFLLPPALVTVMLLSACGGGGSSAPASPGPAPTTTLTTISATNSAKAASNAYAANVAISNSSGSLTGALTGVSIQGINVSTVSPALDLITRSYQRRVPALLTGIALTESCAGGGTVSISGTVRSDLTPSNGDTVTFTTVNCVEDGVTMNGAFKITLSGLSTGAFTGAAWNATIDALFTAFTVTAANQTVSANGDMKVVINQISPTSNSITVSGASLQTSERAAGVTVANRNLSNYSATGSTQGNTSTGTASFTMSGNTGTLGNFEYSVKTLQPFVSTGGSAPASGALIVNGNATSVTLTVVDATRVRLDYSAKGDGVITQTTTVGWAAFLADL